ncbi:hypothetical protein FHP25_25910 [Vineibacter terrae]|uniref:Antitoxin VbhA domain-containing protein n=2 Tax=Vineibacter terrae TaxID=2586908 RepID=A0A5C8PEX6_9HYPH|nr:hypothetical protein FHP25_25910 [Vineibacter terrae]
MALSRSTVRNKTPDAATISDAERGRREAAARSARHSLRLEGLTLSAEAQALTERWVAGEITDAEAHAILLERAHARGRD